MSILEPPRTPGARRDPEAARQERVDREAKTARDREQRRTSERESTGLALLVLGLLLGGYGLYTLFFDASGGEVMGREIANLHKLAIGQASLVAGAVFMSAGCVIRTR